MTRKLGGILPKVVIVGRTNVGKSTLFNRFSRKIKSMVLDYDGVTRDYVSATITWNKKSFELIDTGGLAIESEHDDFLSGKVYELTKDLVAAAEVVLFVCDGKLGVTLKDKEIADFLHKCNKEVILAVNKSDCSGEFDQNFYQFNSLGFKKIFSISSVHNDGIMDLIDEVVAGIKDEKVYDENSAFRVAILGKPNVGKSSLLNKILGKDRMLTSQIPGTTRESVSENVGFEGQIIQLTDTAGVRRKARVKQEIEHMMTSGSLQSAKKAHIVLLVVDGSEKRLSDQDLKLLFYMQKLYKAVALVINKMDLLDIAEKTAMEFNMSEHEFFLKKIPIIRTSCLENKNIDRVKKIVNQIRQRCEQKFDREEINDVVKTAMTKKPLYRNGQVLKVSSVSQIENSRFTPTFLLKVNKPDYFGDSQLGYIENRIRRNFDLKGCPVRFSIEKSKR